MSALPPKADIAESDWHVRFVPGAELNAIHFPLTRGCHMREGKRTQHMMPALLDFWFDFASTYSGKLLGHSQERRPRNARRVEIGGPTPVSE